MGFSSADGILRSVNAMNRRARTLNWLLTAALLTGWLPSANAGKSYSSGGHSYSSHSSSSGGSHSFSSGSHSFSSGGSRSSSSGSTHSSSSGGSSSGGTRTSSSGGGSSKSSGASTSRSSSSSGSGKSFNSGGGKSYTSGSTWSYDDRRSYTSSKSYTASSGRLFASGSSKSSAAATTSASAPRTDSSASGMTFDTAAARAKKEEVSKAGLTRYKEAQSPPKAGDSLRPAVDSSSYRGAPPPIPVVGDGSYRSRTYVPDVVTVRTRPARVYTFFGPYYTRPVVIYRDPYDSFFWWWLLDRSLDDRAWWAYHHRYDMDPARYEALVERDQQLEARVAQLESQEVPRDPNYVPPGLDRDLMYSDQYVAHAYNNRPTTAGAIAFWLLAVPTATAVCGFFIWLIWFKRWQTAT